MSALFADRSVAGGALAQQLQAYAGRDDVVVLALPRGGVPVAWEVAQALGAKLDVLVVCRLCVPYQTKLALGAIAGGGAVFIDRQIVASSGVSPQQLEDVLAAGCQDLVRCRALYRGAREPAVLQGRTVIVVDDGVATGASMHAALTALRVAKPEWIVVAVPAAPPGAQDRIGTAADEFVSVMSPPDFRSVGQYYRDFGQVSDEQVRGLLSYADLHRT
ncbi:MAG: phosphoribosyltransferase family protein [Polaromonas sp.]|uniref:phosphoribosyltransferase n=1 Tax=Polaromonas sp. TaxID=1869339 RepID=UPI00273111D1|nr:phosphoribosyltransferase family protein [Polaromonas sp.]MDP2256118.1 phosphoribosyltransferase family protein [Polaromonas sp.]